jgi:hypothetical protein
MPLVPEQDIVYVSVFGRLADAVAELHKKIEDYPDCRIVSITSTFDANTRTIGLIAIVETV